MPGHVRLGRSERGDEVGDAVLASGQDVQDGQAHRIAEAAEELGAEREVWTFGLSYRHMPIIEVSTDASTGTASHLDGAGSPRSSIQRDLTGTLSGTFSGTRPRAGRRSGTCSGTPMVLNQGGPATDQRSATVATTADLPTLIDLPAVALRLGVNERHVRRLVAERRIPFIKWGHLIRFDPAEIRDWLNNARCPLGGHPTTVQPPAPVRSLPRRRPAQAEPSDPSPRQMRLDP